ncbi:hypothetical protein [Micromonospora arida]|uniref:Uncharacterized protein n=1 Tax=Micromonospora arida TaxID=2203715 RepID=A0A3N9WLS7_9ACTN|nr:hypothetical protein [Micromonospora arida]RQX01609.1 hypothetical protein DLJ58_32280 [Micromonospora arida]
MAFIVSARSMSSELQLSRRNPILEPHMPVRHDQLATGFDAFGNKLSYISMKNMELTRLLI